MKAITKFNGKKLNAQQAKSILGGGGGREGGRTVGAGQVTELVE